MLNLFNDSLPKQERGMPDGERTTPKEALFFVFSLLLVLGVLLEPYFAHLFDPNVFDKELMMLFPYHQYVDPELFRGDYITTYLQRISWSPLYDGLNYLWARLFGEVEVFHRYVMPLAMLGLYALGAFLAGRKIGGLPMAWGLLVFSFMQNNLLFRMTGAAPHVFSFPLLIWIVVALQYRSVWGLIALSILPSALYPVITPFAGLSLAWFLLFTPAELRGCATVWPLWKRLVVLGATGLVTVLLAYFTHPDASAYGQYMAPGTHLQEFPENGQDSQHYWVAVFDPLTMIPSIFICQFSFISASVELLRRAVFAFASFCFFGSVCFLFGQRQLDTAQLLRPILIAALLITVATFLLVFTTAYRFLFYALHFLVALLGAFMLVQLCRRYVSPRWIWPAIVFFVGVPAMLLSQPYPGLWGRTDIELSSQQVEVLQVIRTLPKDSLIAGWPTHQRISGLAPYLAKHPVFLTQRTHYTTHRDYALEMKRRTLAFIAAYFAPDRSPIVRLYEEWGVDYLVVRPLDFQRKYRPIYFAPYQRVITETWKTNRAKGFYLANPPTGVTFYRTEDLYILDLAALAEETGTRNTD